MGDLERDSFSVHVDAGVDRSEPRASTTIAVSSVIAKPVLVRRATPNWGPSPRSTRRTGETLTRPHRGRPRGPDACGCRDGRGKLRSSHTSILCSRGLARHFALVLLFAASAAHKLRDPRETFGAERSPTIEILPAGQRQDRQRRRLDLALGGRDRRSALRRPGGGRRLAAIAAALLLGDLQRSGIGVEPRARGRSHIDCGCLGPGRTADRSRPACSLFRNAATRSGGRPAALPMPVTHCARIHWLDRSDAARSEEVSLTSALLFLARQRSWLARPRSSNV